MTNAQITTMANTPHPTKEKEKKRKWNKRQYLAMSKIQNFVNIMSIEVCVCRKDHLIILGYGSLFYRSDISLQGYHGSVSYTCGTPLNYPFIIW